MKNSTYKTLSIFILLTALSLTVYAQTNVSGGIYTSTTWTLANSPYIVVDTIVVFPGATLTIQPGVVVKFANNKLIEIRQATLVAMGNANDSITFTSASTSPYPGIYDGIKLDGLGVAPTTAQFSHCNFKYAKAGFGCLNGENSISCHRSYFTNNISGISPLYDWRVALIDSCHFEYNTNGMLGYSTQRTYISNSLFNNNVNGISQIENAKIINCSFNNNTGIAIQTFQGDSIDNCQILNNDTAIYLQQSGGASFIDVRHNIITNNNLGILLSGYNFFIICNKICNNTIYNLKYTLNTNTSVGPNYWCTSDSLQVAPTIYDGYDNISLGLVSFMPIDTLQCYLTTPVNEIENHSRAFTFFPNPVLNYLNLNLRNNLSKAKLNIYNLLGELEYTSIIVQQKTSIDVSTLTSGMHIIEVAAGDNINKGKFIKQKNIR